MGASNQSSLLPKIGSGAIHGGTVKSPSATSKGFGWKDAGTIASKLWDQWQKSGEQQQQVQPLPMIPLPELSWNPYYIDPYRINAMDQAPYMAKRGGKFYPGDTVVVGEGSGPEVVKVEEDGARVIPHPADLPQIMTEPMEPDRALPMIPREPNTAVAAPLPVTVPDVPVIAPNPLDAEIVEASRPLTTDYRKEAHDRRLASGKKEHNKWSRVAAAIMGWAKGGLLGGIEAARNPHYWEDVKAAEERSRALPQIEALAKIRDAQTADRYKRVQIGNVIEDNERQRQQAIDLTDWRKSETARKLSADEARERTARMKTVAGMLKDLPEFIPGDPRFKEIEEALGDVGLPISQKDAKKKVDLKQDQRTGQWTVILTDPLTGKQQVRNVLKDGKPFASTPTVVMQGELGLLRQNDAQEFQAQENAKTRQFQANLAGAKAQFQIAMKQMGEAQAKVKAIEAFKRMYFSKHGTQPTNEQVNEYIGTITAPDEE